MAIEGKVKLLTKIYCGIKAYLHIWIHRLQFRFLFRVSFPYAILHHKYFHLSLLIFPSLQTNCSRSLLHIHLHLVILIFPSLHNCHYFTCPVYVAPEGNIIAPNPCIMRDPFLTSPSYIIPDLPLTHLFLFSIISI